MKSVISYNESPVFSSTGPIKKGIFLSKVHIVCNHLIEPISKNYIKRPVVVFHHQVARAGLEQPAARLKKNVAVQCSI